MGRRKQVAGPAAGKRRWRPGGEHPAVERHRSGGIGGALSRASRTRAKRGNPVRSNTSSLSCSGKPTVRKAEARGGNRMPKKPTAAAERQREQRGARLHLQVAAAYNRPHTRPGVSRRKAADVGRWAFDETDAGTAEPKGSWAP